MHGADQVKQTAQKFDHEIYSPEEAKGLLIALRASGRYELEIAVNLAFWCGCRREETCALEWPDVDMENRGIKICISVIMICGIQTLASNKYPGGKGE